MTIYQQTKARIMLTSLRAAYKAYTFVMPVSANDRREAKEWFDNAHRYIVNKDLDGFRKMFE